MRLKLKLLAPTLRRCTGRCPPRGLACLGAARRLGLVTPTLPRYTGRCPPRGLALDLGVFHGA